jgi:hypothetical protein
MRLVLPVALLVAAPLGAQKPDTVVSKWFFSDDTAAVRAAALTFAERVTPLRVSHIKRVVADTAWVAIYDPRTDVIDIPSDRSTTAGTAVRVREVRVERRDGKWVRLERPR